MQIMYYSMDRMFFSDTYFTWGFDDKIEKNIEPWWEFHSGPACCSVKLWKLSSKFLYNPETKLGILDSPCLSVCPSVCLSVTLSCPPCSIYSSEWILSIFGTNDQ